MIDNIFLSETVLENKKKMSNFIQGIVLSQKLKFLYESSKDWIVNNDERKIFIVAAIEKPITIENLNNTSFTKIPTGLCIPVSSYGVVHFRHIRTVKGIFNKEYSLIDRNNSNIFVFPTPIIDEKNNSEMNVYLKNLGKDEIVINPYQVLAVLELLLPIQNATWKFKKSSFLLGSNFDYQTNPACDGNTISGPPAAMPTNLFRQQPTITQHNFSVQPTPTFENTISGPPAAMPTNLFRQQPTQTNSLGAFKLENTNPSQPGLMSTNLFRQQPSQTTSFREQPTQTNSLGSQAFKFGNTISQEPTQTNSFRPTTTQNNFSFQPTQTFKFGNTISGQPVAMPTNSFRPRPAQTNSLGAFKFGNTISGQPVAMPNYSFRHQPTTTQTNAFGSQAFKFGNTISQEPTNSFGAFKFQSPISDQPTNSFRQQPTNSFGAFKFQSPISDSPTMTQTRFMGNQIKNFTGQPNSIGAIKFENSFSGKPLFQNNFSGQPTQAFGSTIPTQSTTTQNFASTIPTQSTRTQNFASTIPTQSTTTQAFASTIPTQSTTTQAFGNVMSSTNNVSSGPQTNFLSKPTNTFESSIFKNENKPTHPLPTQINVSTTFQTPQQNADKHLFPNFSLEPANKIKSPVIKFSSNITFVWNRVTDPGDIVNVTLLPNSAAHYQDGFVLNDSFYIDLFSNTQVSIDASKAIVIPTGICVEFPSKQMLLQVWNLESAKETFLSVLDEGELMKTENGEILVCLINHGIQTISISRGEKIGRLVAFEIPMDLE